MTYEEFLLRQEVTMFHIAEQEDIKSGRVTDVYFARTLEILKKKGIDKRVRTTGGGGYSPAWKRWPALWRGKR
jgi:nicotinate phosphoribosyltransferase